MNAVVRIGVSGWRYPPWRGHFYPEGLPQRRELEFISRQFPTAEINGTFYGLQRPQSYEGWAAQTPPGFVFAVKAVRYITHERRLRDVEAALVNFFASGVFSLGDKLGPILWQLPPSLAFDAALLADFCALLPGQSPSGHRLRHAMEVRHASFVDAAFIRLLRRHGIAWVVSDTPRPWPHFHDVTADFVYLRLHGASELYRSRYSGDQLDLWALRIRAWSEGREPPDARRIAADDPPAPMPRDVFCYFDNTDKRHAPDNARDLMHRLAAG